MKILFLNVWNAALEEPLVAYLKEEMKDIDIFCFQEYFEDAHNILYPLLHEFTLICAQKEIDAEHTFAQATFVRRHIPIRASVVQFEEGANIGFGIWTHVYEGDRSVSICNYHGHAQPGHKKDTEERIFASRLLLETAKNFEGVTIIGGDFNLDIDTCSVGLFSEHGYRDLIDEYDINTTRNRYVWELYPEKMYYSDYVFIRGAEVKGFEVPRNEVSDHLPLILEI